MAKVLGIAISESEGAEMVVVASAKVTIEGGIGDDYKGNDEELKNQQITVMSIENWDKACEEIGKNRLHWTNRNANIVVEGIDLEGSTGDILKLGDFYIEITGEFTPEGMDDKVIGLQKALTPNWRGGITGKVVVAGVANENDEVKLMERA